MCRDTVLLTARKYVHTISRKNYLDRLFDKYTVSGKRGTLFFAITLPNPNRSSKFFYHHTQQEICSKRVNKYLATIHLRRYTLPCKMLWSKIVNYIVGLY